LSSAAAARTFSARAASTEGLPFITRETVASETPARAATSAMVRDRVEGEAATFRLVLFALGGWLSDEPIVYLCESVF
jgi:hypothetical protein